MVANLLSRSTAVLRLACSNADIHKCHQLCVFFLKAALTCISTFYWGPCADNSWPVLRCRWWTGGLDAHFKGRHKTLFAAITIHVCFRKPTNEKRITKSCLKLIIKLPLCHCGVGLCGLLTIFFIKLTSLCVSLSPCAKPLKLCPQSSHFTARSSPFYSPSYYLHLAPPTWQIMLFHFGHIRRGGRLICFQNHCNSKNPLLGLLFVMPCKHYI